MKKYVIYILVIFLLTACKGNTGSSKDTNGRSKENLSGENRPDKNTEYDTLYTVNAAGNTQLLQELKTKLEAAGFTFEERKGQREFSYNNCEENRVKLIRGAGVRIFFARSKQPVKGTKDYYPDFMIRVYEFSTNALAKQSYAVIENALNSSGQLCKMKVPGKLVMNGKDVFHLVTRAEMFRTYTDQYGEIIQNYR